LVQDGLGRISRHPANYAINGVAGYLVCDAFRDMSPELETLDQLLGSDLSLGIVLRLYPDAAAFKRGVLGLIAGGDVYLLTSDNIEVPDWRCRELFADGSVTQEMEQMKLRITAQGALRIK
jgi:hypothetical protein